MMGKKNKRIAIMQPTYLPWLGYFDLIDMVDTFVFLDSVQFEKQTWQQRNQIKTHQGLEWITVPVLIKGKFGQHINDVALKDQQFVRKHLKQIEQNYKKAPAFDQYYPAFETMFKEAASTNQLCELNIKMIEWLSEQLGIQTTFVRSSSLNVDGKRSERIVNIMKALESTTYISPRGSAEYIQQDGAIFDENNIGVSFQHYVHPEYDQLYKTFAPFASAIDLLFNVGASSGDVMRSGRQDLIPVQEMTLS